MRINFRPAAREAGAVVALLAVASIASVATTTVDLRLVEAAKSGDTAAVRTLLTEGVPVNTPPPDGVTALHWAALGDHAEMADLLIRGGALVDATDHYAVTPLSLACVNASPVMVERLLEAGANPNAVQATGRDGADDVRARGCAGRGHRAPGPRRGRERDGSLARADRVDVGGVGRTRRGRRQR